MQRVVCWAGHLFSHLCLQVVFAGLDIILPLMSVDLLKFPKLGRQYFTLLAYMAEVSHRGKCKQLNAKAGTCSGREKSIQLAKQGRQQYY